MNRFIQGALASLLASAFCSNAGAQLGEVDRDTLTQVVAQLSTRTTHAAPVPPRMSREEYVSAWEQVQLDFKAASKSCGALKHNARDVCMAGAKGREKVAKAELEARVKGTLRANHDLRIARADAEFGIAREKCDDKAGHERNVCRKEAKAAHVSASADAEAALRSAEANAASIEKTLDARQDAEEKKRDAEFAVARERCDVFASEAKSRCLDKVKSQFGRS